MRLLYRPLIKNIYIYIYIYIIDWQKPKSLENYLPQRSFVYHKSPLTSRNLNLVSINVNKKVQLDSTVCRHLFTAKSLYMFRASQHPSSGALKTVTATSGIGHNTGIASIMTYTRGSGYSF